MWRLGLGRVNTASVSGAQAEEKPQRPSLGASCQRCPCRRQHPRYDHVPPPCLVPGRGELAARLPTQSLRALVSSPRCLLVPTTAWWCLSFWLPSSADCLQACVLLMEESCPVVPRMRVCSSPDSWRRAPQGVKIYPRFLPAQARPQCAQTPCAVGTLFILTVAPGARSASEMA